MFNLLHSSKIMKTTSVIIDKVATMKNMGGIEVSCAPVMLIIVWKWSTLLCQVFSTYYTAVQIKTYLKAPPYVATMKSIDDF